MPMFHYRCADDACGCWQEAFRHHGKRDEAPPCLECRGPSQRGTYGELAHSAPAPIAGIAPRQPIVRETGLLNAATGERYRILDRVCTVPECEFTEESVDVTLDADGDPGTDPAACETCGAETRWQAIDTGHSRFSELFPYYDEGLGCTVTSKRHRREVMRQLGVEEVGDVSAWVERTARQQEDEDREIVANYEGDVERYTTHPALRKAYAEATAGRGPTST